MSSTVQAYHFLLHPNPIPPVVYSSHLLGLSSTEYKGTQLLHLFNLLKTDLHFLVSHFHDVPLKHESRETVT